MRCNKIFTGGKLCGHPLLLLEQKAGKFDTMRFWRREGTQNTTAQDKDKAAFDKLYAEYAPRVQSYLRLMTGNRAEAEDLMQETFLAAYHCRHTYKGDAQPLAWLLGIARRRWRDGTRGIRPKQVALSEEIVAPTDMATQIVEASHRGNGRGAGHGKWAGEDLYAGRTL